MAEGKPCPMCEGTGGMLIYKNDNNTKAKNCECCGGYSVVFWLEDREKLKECSKIQHIF